MRILLIDDEDVVLLPIARLLRQLDYAVECAHSGEEALQTIERQPVDLVISDVRMPGMDGFQLARTIQTKRPDLPIILMAGFVDGETRSRAERERIYRLLSKPVDIKELVAVIEDVKARESGP